MTRRQTASIVFVVLCVVLVAAAVTLNIGWILVNGRRVAPLVLRRHHLLPDHRGPHRLHGVPGPRNGHHRTTGQLPQLGHARVEDADRVDPPLPRDAAVARGRRRAAQGVLPDHAAGRRSAAAHGRAGAARRRGAAEAASSNIARRSISAGWCRSASTPRARAITSAEDAIAIVGVDLADAARRQRRRRRPAHGDRQPARQRREVFERRAADHGAGRRRHARHGVGARQGCRRRHSAARSSAASSIAFIASSRSGSKVKGTGLGLYIVRSIAKRHGGRVFAESTGENKGSTFTLELPQNEGACPERAAARAASGRESKGEG